MSPVVGSYSCAKGTAFWTPALLVRPSVIVRSWTGGADAEARIWEKGNEIASESPIDQELSSDGLGAAALFVHTLPVLSDEISSLSIAISERISERLSSSDFFSFVSLRLAS